MRILDVLRGWPVLRQPGRCWWLGAWVAVLMSWAGSASAAPLFVNCSPRQFSLSPAMSGIINVPQTVGTVLYTGTVTASFACDVGQSNQGYVLGTSIGTNTFLFGSNRTLTLTLSGQNLSMAGEMGGTCAATPLFSNAGTTQSFITVAVNGASGRCRIIYRYQVTIKVASIPTVDTDWPPDNGPAQGPPGNNTCTFRGTPPNPNCSWVVQGAGGVGDYNFTNGGPVSTARFVRISCTLSTPNMTVALQPAQATALAGAGSFTTAESFNLNLTGCGALASPYTVNSTWTYTADSGMATMIANTASTPAANVGIQILDDLNNVIANNAVVPLATVSAAGNYTKTFKARYVSKGTAQPGGVKGVAQYTLTYQ